MNSYAPPQQRQPFKHSKIFCKDAVRILLYQIEVLELL